MYIPGHGSWTEVIPPPGSYPAPPLDLESLREAAKALGGSVTVVTADKSDVENISFRVERSINSVAAKRGPTMEGSGVLPAVFAGHYHAVIFSPRWIGISRMKQVFINIKSQHSLFRARTLIILVFLFGLYSPSVMAFEWLDLWLTPDQQGQRLMAKGEYQIAAGKFTTPERIGTALFLAGDFENAATVFGRSASAEANYNRGNALVMQGQYESAVEAYQNALMKKPDWPAAQQNLEIAKLRLQALAPPEDDAGGTGGQLGADEIVFDDSGRVNKSSNEEVIDAGEQQMGEQEMRAMWLRKVETRPADFLAARFNYQLATRDDQSGAQSDENPGENSND